MNNTTQMTPTAITNHVQEVVMLLDGTTVSKAFFDKVRLRVERAIPNLIQEKSYTLKEICGHRFWGPLGTGGQIMAGKCVSLMVAEQTVPLVLIGKNSRNAHLYSVV